MHLGQMSLNPDRDMETLRKICRAAIALPFIQNEPVDVSEDSLLDAMLNADRLGLEIADSLGDAPYSSLHEK